MTNEEAITYANCLKNNYTINFDDMADFCDIAIKALKQEPCEDCISRQAVLDLVVANHTELNGVNVVMYSPFCKDIKQLSPVTPKAKSDVLDKIKAEIERKAHSGQWSDATMYGMLKAVAIIDKYKAESEE